MIKELVNDVDLPKSSNNRMVNFNFDQYLYRCDLNFLGHRLYLTCYHSELMGNGIFGRYFMDFLGSFKTLAKQQSETGIEAFYNFAITP